MDGHSINLDILIWENDSAIGMQVRHALAEMNISPCMSVHCDELAAFDTVAREKPDILLYCSAFGGEEKQDEEILRELRGIDEELRIVIVAKTHSLRTARLALECGAEWVLTAKEELTLLGDVLARLERKRSEQLRRRDDLARKEFLEWIREESGNSREFFLSDVQLPGPEYFLYLIRILPPYRSRVKLEERSFAVLKGYDILQGKLLKSCAHLAVRDGQDLLVCFSGTREQTEDGRKMIRDFLTEMREFSVSVSTCSAWAAESWRIEDPRELPESYRRCRREVEERLLSDTFTVLPVHRTKVGDESGTREEYWVFDIRKSLTNALEVFDKEAIRKSLLQLKSNIAGASGINGGEIFNIYKTLLSALSQELEGKGLHPEEIGLDFAAMTADSDSFCTVDDVFSAMENYYVEGMNHLREREENSLPAPVLLAKRYIRAFFNMPLSLVEISDYVGMNENYFSDYFKKNTGMTFKQYQTELRVKYAKQMLLDKQYSLEDISDAVGYNDVKYFQRVFKRVTGIAPGEYRRKYHVLQSF